jgi:hypothetical protein
MRRHLLFSPRASLHLATVLFFIWPAFSQVTFEKGVYPAADYSTIKAGADLNGDGATDLIVSQLNGLGTHEGFDVYISNGDGTFQPPVNYAVPGGSSPFAVVTADVNRDGKTDVIADLGDGFAVFLGNGDGTLGPPTRTQLNQTNLIGPADVNHDGKVDLILIDSHGGVSVMYGNGDGTFKSPILVYTVTVSTGVSNWTLGDFDGDGNIDIEMNGSSTGRNNVPNSSLILLYGDGKGGFTPVVQENINAYLALLSADVNQDGRADLVGSFDCAAAGCGNGVQVFYGNSNRTVTSERYAAKGIVQMYGRAVGDFNGDGRLDIALAYGSAPDLTAGVAVFTRTKTGTYSGKRLFPLFSGDSDYVASLMAGDFNRDSKSDLATTAQRQGSLQVLLNTSAGQFSKCSAPGPVGIHVCNPLPGTTVSSPVLFHIAAASFLPIRKIEVWIDGVKKSETYYSWGLFAFSNPRVQISSGSHRADFYAGNWDGTLQHSSITFTVK